MLITLTEAAALFRVSVYTIKRWLKSGKLRGIKTPGNQWRVHKDSCLDLLNKAGGPNV